ncbi:hypothetical protein E4O93_22585 [Diaphorobacter sp. DS2]|nr:hypothetical protein E4O93_22585 [Diaphorobacter sp. DS2]
MHTASQALAIERQASAQTACVERVSRPKTRAILGLMRLNFLSVQGQGTFASTVRNLQAAGMSAEQAYAQINRLIDQQAFTRAADDIFLASSFLFLSLIVLIWFTKRPASAAGAADAAAGAH